jgi:hypothetical protein
MFGSSARLNGFISKAGVFEIKPNEKWIQLELDLDAASRDK